MNPGGIIFDPATIDRITYTLLHFLWEGLALGLLLVATLFVLRRRSSTTRYVACCATLVLMALAPIVTYHVLGNRFVDPGPLLLDSFAAAGDDGATGTMNGYPGQLMRLARRHGVWLIGAWMIGTGLLLVRQVVSWVWLWWLLPRETSPLGPQWQRLLIIPRRLGIRRLVLFRESRLVDVPATLGWLKPIVLVPAAALSGLTADQLEALIAHELAHVRRHDYLVNLLQVFVETVLFYHPVVWWVSRRIREERENCCDDVAATMSGPHAYARALVALDELRTTVPRHALSAAGGVLWSRIARLVGSPRGAAGLQSSPKLWAAAAGAGVLCLLISHVLGAAVVVPPRSAEQVKPFSAGVYEILGVAGSGGRFLPALAETVAAYDGSSEPSHDQLHRLAVAITADPDHDALSFEAFRRMRLAEPHAYQRSSDWAYGRYDQRVRLVRALWGRAILLRSGDPSQARLHARAALLLGAQDSNLCGVKTLDALLRDSMADGLADLDPSASIRFRRHVQDHQVITRACFVARDELRDVLRAGKARTPQEVVGRLAEMARLAKQRPDVQWSIAVLWQDAAAALDEASLRDGEQELADLVGAADDGPFRRWLRESDLTDASAPARPAQRRLTMDGLRRIREN